MTDKLSDEWRTPDWLFDELNQEFNFDVDLCATAENSKCAAYCEDYLKNILKYNDSRYDHDFKILLRDKEHTFFLNPPYSNPKPFIEKAWEDSKHCKIVCLVKCDPSTRWWATFWLYSSLFGCYDNNGPKPGCEVRFFPKRIKFDPPKGQKCCSCSDVHGTGFYVGSVRSCKSCKEPLLSGPTFSSALLIFDRRNI